VNKPIGYLLTILIIQIAIVVAVLLPASDLLDSRSSEPLFPFDHGSIDEIYVEDDEGNEAVLLKMADQWILPDLSGLPVKLKRVDALIGSISDSEGQWPVATSAASRQRFQVAAYHFQRRITLIGAGELFGTLYLGTSPRFRQVHARNDAQDAIYSIPFNNFEAPTQASAWLDTSILQIANPIKISSSDYSLTKQGARWISEQSQTPDESELERLLTGLRKLEIEGLADGPMLPNLEIAAPALTLNIETPDGSLRLEFLSIGDQHFVRSDRYRYYFTLSKAEFDRLVSIYGPALNNTILAPQTIISR
jgi:hypothetical protein